MNTPFRNQSQFELFPGPSKKIPDPGRSSRLTKDLTLSLENIIVLSIVFVMAFVLFFSFGVEKGKKIALLPDMWKEASAVAVSSNAGSMQPASSSHKAESQSSGSAPVGEWGSRLKGVERSSKYADGAAGSTRGESTQTELRVVVPVAVPREAAEETHLPASPPLEKHDEQEKLFTIQVASFKLEENARKEADRLKDVGHADTFVISKGSHTIVCIGKFGQMSQAKALSGKLKKKYSDCLVRRL